MTVIYILQKCTYNLYMTLYILCLKAELWLQMHLPLHCGFPASGPTYINIYICYMCIIIIVPL